jgi:hypothetical protein
MELKESDILGCWCYPEDCHGNAIIEIWQDLTSMKETENLLKNG